MERLSDQMLSKNGQVARRIAADLVHRKLGEKIPRVEDYQRRFRVGSGTVQRALEVLEELGAISLQTRGHLGSFLTGKSLALLWQVAGLPTVTGVMPLPTSREFQGLASGLRGEFERIGVPLNMLYAHGSSHRIQLLREARVHFAVMSRAAAEAACAAQTEPGVRLKILTTLEPGSYYAPDSVVVISSGREAGRRPSDVRVGIDESSYDHSVLSRSEFGEGQFVDIRYSEIPQALYEGRIDIAVWHRTALSVPLEAIGLKTRPLSSPAAIEASARMTAAAVLAGRHARLLEPVFSAMDLSRVRKTQQAIVSFEMAPIY